MKQNPRLISYTLTRGSVVDLELLAAMDALVQKQVEERAEDSQPGNADDFSAGGAQVYGYVLLALSVVSVALRFWSRSLGDRGIQRFWWDDWMSLISLASCPNGYLDSWCPKLTKAHICSFRSHAWQLVSVQCSTTGSATTRGHSRNTT